MQERIINFVSKNSRIKPERFRELMMKKDELVMDVGDVYKRQVFLSRLHLQQSPKLKSRTIRV